MNHYKKIYFSDLFEMDFCYSIFGPLPFRNERHVATLSLKVEKKLDIYLLFDGDINNQYIPITFTDKIHIPITYPAVSTTTQ